MEEQTSTHYSREYFDWQASIGEFGGWANLEKFAPHVPRAATVLDFGCGGGFLLKNLDCGERLGVEINPVAAEAARSNGVRVFRSAADVPDDQVDVIISNHALEHTLNPLSELRELYKKLKVGGRIVFVVPCESVARRYIPGDVNHHLYSWSPMCIGNLFTEAGFSVIESKAYLSKWPPKHRLVARLVGPKLFSTLCRVYARLERSWFQVRIVAEKGRTDTSAPAPAECRTGAEVESLANQAEVVGNPAS